MKKSTQLLISGGVGLILMLIILVLAVIYPCPSPHLYNIFRIIISVAVGAFAAIIPGLFEFKFNGVVTAAGALAVFAFVFVYDPAKLIVSDEDDGCRPDLSLSGIVYLNNKETRNVDVRVSQLKKSDVTDAYGTFKIEYPRKENKKTYNFRAIYATSLDTSFELNNNDWKNLKFYFKTKKNVIAFNPKSVSDKLLESKVMIQTLRKEIKNYFEGNLYETSIAYYGGPPYCNYTMKYTDIKIQTKLSKDMANVESAKVSFQAIEKVSDGCPYQVIPSNTHIYDLSDAQVKRESIFISFVPDRSNNPQCSLTLIGTIKGKNIIAILYSERMDVPEPILSYKIKMEVQLQMLE